MLGPDLNEAQCNGQDPLLLDDQVSEDKRSSSEAPSSYRQDKLLPKVLDAFMQEKTGPEIFPEIGSTGRSGATIPEASGGQNLSDVGDGINAREVG